MKYPRVKRHLMVLNTSKGQVKFGWHEDNAYIAENIGEPEMLLINMLNGKYTTEKIIEVIKQKFPKIDEKDILTTINDLEKANILEDAIIVDKNDDFSDEEMKLYDRQLLYFKFTRNNHINVQKAIKNSRILLLGLGGGGSAVAYNLAVAGVGYILAIDFDTVEYSNLNRSMLFSYDDLGKYKTDVALSKIKKYNPLIEFEILKLKIDSPEVIMKLLNSKVKFDFIIQCIDRPHGIRSFINDACMATNIPYIGGGYIENKIGIGPLCIPHKTACWNCYEKRYLDKSPLNIPFKESILLTERYNAASFGPQTSILGGMIALEVLKYIGKFDEPRSFNKRIYLDLHTMDISYDEIIRLKDCPSCGKSITIKERKANV